MVNSSKFIKLIGLSLVEVVGNDSYLDLGESEIEEMGSDHYHNFKSAGVRILFRNRKLVHAQFYNENMSNYDPFVGTLPFELEFSCSKTEVRKRMGEPDKTTGSAMSNWDIYHRERKSIHIQ